ncbi:hypothetical protein ES703_62437 [subsurface metagenome]
METMKYLNLQLGILVVMMTQKMSFYPVMMMTKMGMQMTLLDGTLWIVIMTPWIIMGMAPM